MLACVRYAVAAWTFRPFVGETLTIATPLALTPK